MNETKQDSGADFQDLQELEFHKILDMSIEDLMEKAWTEQWKVKHVEFWLKVKNAQNFEKVLTNIESYLDYNRSPEVL